MVDAAEEDRRRTRSRSARADESADRWQAGAARFREDPFRAHETLQTLLSYIQPSDTVLDVGGGAGRYLPLALHCREYVNVEPSPGMAAQFELSVREAGITNARCLQSAWEQADITGDVGFSANVVYYIADIVPFIAKLHAASRRRVMLVLHSVPPRNAGADVARIVHGRVPIPDPGYRELLPVLWDMGLLPDVRVLGSSDFIVERGRYPDRATAIAAVVPGQIEDGDRARVTSALEAHFDELFIPTPEGGYRRRPQGESRVLLITWETQR
jgi:hypothetical protein